MGTLIMVAITLIAGSAVFGYVNGQAATSVGSYSNAVNEKFTIVYAFFPAANQLSVAIYNSGSIPLGIISLSIVDPSGLIAVFPPSAAACSGTYALGSPTLPARSSPMEPLTSPVSYTLQLPISGTGCLTSISASGSYSIIAFGLNGFSTRLSVMG